MARPLRIAAVVTPKPSATREDVARIEYAVSLCEQAARNLVDSYGLPAVVSVDRLD